MGREETDGAGAPARVVAQASPTSAPQSAAARPECSRRTTSIGLLSVRYGIGGLLVVVSIVLLVVDPGGFGLEGFGMAAGSGLSVLMLNYLYRIGVSGDEERTHEEDARRYLAEHGRWPDDERSRTR